MPEENENIEELFEDVIPILNSYQDPEESRDRRIKKR